MQRRAGDLFSPSDRRAAKRRAQRPPVQAVAAAAAAAPPAASSGLSTFQRILGAPSNWFSRTGGGAPAPVAPAAAARSTMPIPRVELTLIKRYPVDRSVRLLIARELFVFKDGRKLQISLIRLPFPSGKLVLEFTLTTASNQVNKTCVFDSSKTDDAEMYKNLEPLGRGAFGMVFTFSKTSAEPAIKAFSDVCIKVQLPSDPSFDYRDEDENFKVEKFIRSDATFLDDAKRPPQGQIFPHPFFNAFHRKIQIEVMERLVPLKSGYSQRMTTRQYQQVRKHMADFGKLAMTADGSTFARALVDVKYPNFALRQYGRNELDFRVVRIDFPPFTDIRDNAICNSYCLRCVPYNPSVKKDMLRYGQNLDTGGGWRGGSNWVDSLAALLKAMYPDFIVADADWADPPRMQISSLPHGADHDMQLWSLYLLWPPDVSSKFSERSDPVKKLKPKEYGLLDDLWTHLTGVVRNTYLPHGLSGVKEQLDFDGKTIEQRLRDPTNVRLACDKFDRLCEEISS